MIRLHTNRRRVLNGGTKYRITQQNDSLVPLSPRTQDRCSKFGFIRSILSCSKSKLERHRTDRTFALEKAWERWQRTIASVLQIGCNPRVKQERGRLSDCEKVALYVVVYYHWRNPQTELVSIYTPIWNFHTCSPQFADILSSGICDAWIAYKEY